MKKIILKSLITLLFSLILSFGFAQKCKVKEDPITGEQTCQFMNSHKTLRFEYKGGDVTDFFITFAYDGDQKVVIPKGSKTIFKLKDNTIITLHSLSDAVPQTTMRTSKYSIVITSFYTFAFKLSREQIKSLASSKITFIRYPSIDGGTLDVDVKGFAKIFINKIMKGATCIFAHMDNPK